MANPNHPPKGAIITVDPIRETKHIRAIKKILADKPRDLALFVVGINTNLPSSCVETLAGFRFINTCAFF